MAAFSDNNKHTIVDLFTITDVVPERWVVIGRNSYGNKEDIRVPLNPIIQIPDIGDVWTAKRVGVNWELEKKIKPILSANYEPGDTILGNTSVRGMKKDVAETIGPIGEAVKNVANDVSNLWEAADGLMGDLAGVNNEIDAAQEALDNASALIAKNAQEVAAAQARIDQAKIDISAAQKAADDAGAQAETNKTNIAAQVSRSDTIEQAASSAQSTANTAKGDAAKAQTAADAAAKAATAASTAAGTAQTSADQANNLAKTAKESADQAKKLADAAQSTADTASSAAEAAQSTATGAASSAAAAQTTANSAATAASAAQSTADMAKGDAATAAGIAGGKADVLIQSSVPATTMRKATTLWIDTTNAANTPKRWSGTAWVEVTDKTAKDAAGAAANAQTTANKAVTDAKTAKDAADAADAKAAGAQSTADAASSKATTADGRITIASANPTTTDAAGKPIGAVWEVRSGGTTLRRYVLTAATTWTQVKIGQEYVGDKAIGRAQIGDAAIGTAQIGDATITNAKIGDVSVDKLSVTGTAKMPTAVIDNLMTQQAFLDNLVAKKVVVQGGPNKVGTVLIEDGAITAEKANIEDLTAAIAKIINLDAGHITSGIIQTGLLNAEEIAAAVANIIKINTSQLVVTDTAFLDKAVVDQIVASIAAFNALVVTSDMLANDVGKNLDVSGNPSVADKANQSDLDALDGRVSSVEPIRNAVVVEPTGITITDNKQKPNQVVISNSRLGFVSDGSEVAWIDGRAETMHISNVEIEDGILIGHHLLKAWDANNTIVRWVA